VARNLTSLAKKLRRNSTHAEKVLWNRLRTKQLEGIKFRRQQPIEGIIVDFVSFEKGIVIEVDGGQHATGKANDLDRDRFLAKSGYRVLRFWNNEVLENLEGVLNVIRKACSQ
jgi:very-short-patch-repair endonuclease